MIKQIRLDANYDTAITSCEECSAHEDKDTPSLCLVCNDAPIYPNDYVYQFPVWCPLMVMAVIDPEVQDRKKCALCEGRVKLVVDGDMFKYGACRNCGVRYYQNRDDQR